MTKKLISLALLCTILTAMCSITAFARYEELYKQPSNCTLEQVVSQNGLYIMNNENNFTNIRPNVSGGTSYYALLDPDYSIYKIHPDDTFILAGGTDFEMYPVKSTGWTIDSSVYVSSFNFDENNRLNTNIKELKIGGTYYTEYNNEPIKNFLPRVKKLDSSTYFINANPYEEFRFGRYDGTKYIEDKYIANKNYFMYDIKSGYHIWSTYHYLPYTLTKTKKGYSIVNFEDKVPNGYYVIHRKFKYRENNLVENLNCEIIVHVNDNYTKRGVTMYAPDGRTITVDASQINVWRNVGWYTDPVTTVYAPDGRSSVIYKHELKNWLKVGWYTEPVITMYAPGGRSAIIYKWQEEAWKNVGWYNYPVY